jgi:uncharacterized membrane protein YoaK (UPF0700 family)
LGDSAVTKERTRLARSVVPLVGFLAGCGIAGAAVSWLADWAWIFPVVLAGVAVALVAYVPDETEQRARDSF